MARCRKCGYFYRNIKDWLGHQYDHKDGRIKPRKYRAKRRNFVQNTSSKDART